MAIVINSPRKTIKPLANIGSTRSALDVPEKPRYAGINNPRKGNARILDKVIILVPSFCKRFVPKDIQQPIAIAIIHKITSSDA